MRRRNNNETSGLEDAVFDPDSDRYPDFGQVLAKLQDDENLPEGPIERLEIACHASGDATWRVWQPRAEEYIGGFYANSDF